MQAAGPEEPKENRCTSEAQASDMDVVSPLIRSIFENRKKLILEANQRTGGGTAPFHSKHVPQRGPNSAEYEKMLNKKVQALNEEVAIFKTESKRLKSLSKVCELSTSPNSSGSVPSPQAQPLDSAGGSEISDDKTPRNTTVYMRS